MIITVVQTRNRFFRFLDDKTSVLHNEIRDTRKFSPVNWGYSRLCALSWNKVDYRNKDWVYCLHCFWGFNIIILLAIG